MTVVRAATATTTAAANPIRPMIVMPVTARPQIETTTMAPAVTTAVPVVLFALAAAVTTSSPARSRARKRATRKRA